ncbi:Cys/Met metabolism PLP-dependent enzyme-domain-containing protein [Mycena olivaceomarginata]|nr:Cys/Met metabolism PLP-dependent enzyme-domain-containing protein [Mycena olivaceomarginata]
MPRFYREPDFETLQLHAGQQSDPVTNSRAVPVYQTTSYTFDSMEHGANLANLTKPGYLYSRVGNPTVDVFEKRMAALEGGVAAVAASSGMGAITLTISALASAGDNIIAPSRLYGGTYQQFKETFKRYGIEIIFVDTLNPDHFEAAINEKTKAIYVETIANSDNTLADIRAMADMAHRHQICLVVDSTFAMGGYIVRPISLGADIVVHSATKWIGGHGTIVAGVIIDSGNFDWRKSDKYPAINGPASAYNNINLAEVFYPSGFAVHVRVNLLRDLGPCLSPMNAFLALQGIETLSLRAQRHCDNALAVAKYLDAHPHVIQVNYLGLPSHPSHQQALKILRPNAFGGILMFRLEGGFPMVTKVIENLRLASHLANVGDAKTLVIAPFGTIQGQLTEEERASGGVSDDMIRLSVGIESADDIIADLAGALEIAYTPRGYSSL